MRFHECTPPRPPPPNLSELFYFCYYCWRMLSLLSCFRFRCCLLLLPLRGLLFRRFCRCLIVVEDSWGYVFGGYVAGAMQVRGRRAARGTPVHGNSGFSCCFRSLFIGGIKPSSLRFPSQKDQKSKRFSVCLLPGGEYIYILYILPNTPSGSVDVPFW